MKISRHIAMLPLLAGTMLAGVPAMAQELAAELRVEAGPLAAGLKRCLVALLERVADSVGEDGHGFDRGVRPTQEPDKGE